jgi:predicted transcriptional regulator
MDDSDKVKNMLLERLHHKDSFLLNAISAQCQQDNISNESVKTAIQELVNKSIIKTENLRNELWQLKIVKTNT